MRAKELEKLYKVLGNRRRMRIVRLLLKKGKMTVSDIADDINLSFRATSRHLIQLFHVDVLRKEQLNKNVFYEISGSLDQIIKSLISHIHHSGE